VQWLYTITSGLDSWPHTESKMSHQRGSDLQPLQSYRTLKCEWIRTGEHENTQKLVEDMLMFSSNNVTLWKCLNKCSKWTPSAWICSLSRFSVPTETGGCLNMLVVLLTTCVGREMSSKSTGSSLFKKSVYISPVSHCMQPPWSLLKVTSEQKIQSPVPL
jgi:hypothetical protein